MNTNKLHHFKNKLISEKNNVYDLLEEMEENETIDSNSAMSRELSQYDNHPSDTATELFDKEKGLTLKGNEISLLKQIEESIEDINHGEYGICKKCGKNISEHRLEIVPYAKYCIECQNELSSRKQEERYNRPIEEKVLGYPFGYGFNDNTNKVEFDAEDSYQDVELFNRLENIDEYYYEDSDDGYVEPVERISNNYYKNQLPD